MQKVKLAITLGHE